MKRARSPWGYLALILFAALSALVFDRFRARPQFEPDLPVEFHLTNPVRRAPEVMERAELLFRRNCLPCHGKAGHGDGPASVSLNPKPRDLRSPDLQNQTDAFLFYRLTEGKMRTAMPSFGTSLNPQDRWALVHLVRKIGEEARKDETN